MNEFVPPQTTSKASNDMLDLTRKLDKLLLDIALVRVRPQPDHVQHDLLLLHVSRKPCFENTVVQMHV